MEGTGLSEFFQNNSERLLAISSLKLELEMSSSSSQQRNTGKLIQGTDFNLNSSGGDRPTLEVVSSNSLKGKDLDREISRRMGVFFFP